VVEIISNHPEDSQMSVYEQIFETKEGSFVAWRTRPSEARHTSAGTIVMGAPVSAQQETTAEAWFDDLMTKSIATPNCLSRRSVLTASQS